MMQWTDFRHLVRHLPQHEQERIHQAFDFGQSLHDGQLRKSGEPYFSHPVAVAEILSHMGADADTLIAALLHDTIEDTDTTIQDVDARFDGNVAALIEGVTKYFPSDFDGQPHLNDQVETLRKMFTSMEKDVRIMVIKLVDRLHNMRTVCYLSPERQKSLARETLDVYVKIADRLCMQDLRHELEGLCRASLDPALHSALLSLHDENQMKSTEVIPLMRDALTRKSPDLVPLTDIVSEVKPWENLRAQYEAQGSVVTGLSALTVAFVVPDHDACYRMLGALHGAWQRESLSFQDFINSPVTNGYQGLHTTIILSDGTRVRCKIRTKEMQEYSHRGVTTSCFRPHSAENLTQLLPWTKRISPLTEDTRTRSMDFWESLQSDILGDTFTVHGPNDEVAQLPKGATVLDGAFYLFQDKALALQSMHMNGRSVTFGTALVDGVSLTPVFTQQPCAEQEWLQWVQTRFAISFIRGAIAERSTEDKERFGKELLQGMFTDRKKGFIEEFNPKNVAQRLVPLGVPSLRDAYLAIADGKLRASDVFDVLFPASTVAPERTQSVTVQYDMNLHNTDVMDRIIRVHRHYPQGIKEIRYQQNASEQGVTQLKGELSPAQQHELLEELTAAGAKNARLIHLPSFFTLTAGIIVILFLWGLDPVFARLLLTSFPISPIDLTIVRFWSLTLMSGLLLIRTRLRNPLAETPLPLTNPSLWLTVLLLLGVALTTYTALQTTDPSHYTIPMTAAGLLFSTLFHHKNLGKAMLTWFLLIAGITLLIFHTMQWPWQGVAFTFCAVTSFSLFSLVSEEYKRKSHVGIRSVQYLFLLSLLSGILTLPLLPLSNLLLVPLPVILLMVLFSIAIAGLPYFMYYTLLSHQEVDFVLRYSYLIIPVTLVGQWLFSRDPLSFFTLLAGLLVTAGAVLPERFDPSYLRNMLRQKTQNRLP